MKLNRYQLIAGILVFAFGTVFLAGQIYSLHKDIVFYLTATKEVVIVESVHSEIRDIGHGEAPYPTYEVVSDLAIQTSYGFRIASEAFYGRKLQIEDHALALKVLEGQRVEMFISPDFPSYFVLTSEEPDLAFPLKNLFSSLIVLLVMVIPWGGMVFYYFYERRRKKKIISI